MNPWEHSLCNPWIMVKQLKVPLSHVSPNEGDVSFGENRRSSKQELARDDCDDPNWHLMPLGVEFSALGLTYLHFVAAGGHLEIFVFFSSFCSFEFCFPGKRHLAAVIFGIYV